MLFLRLHPLGLLNQHQAAELRRFSRELRHRETGAVNARASGGVVVHHGVERVGTGVERSLAEEEHVTPFRLFQLLHGAGQTIRLARLVDLLPAAIAHPDQDRETRSIAVRFMNPMQSLAAGRREDDDIALAAAAGEHERRGS